MTPLTYAVLVLAGLTLFYLGLSYQLYRRAFVPPRPILLDDFTFTPFEFQADYEDVELVTADGINFGAWHFRQPGSPQTVIISGGHKGQRQGGLGIAIALWRKGFNVVLYSYRGMPGSDRAPVTFGIKEVLELQATIAFARKRIPNARIGLLGYSMGAVVSLLGAAGEPSVQALVLDSPFSDLRKLLVENARSASKIPGTPFVWMAGLMLWPDAVPAVGVPAARRPDRARAAAAVLHPRRRGRDHQRQPQPPPLRRVSRAARDLDRPGRAAHGRVLRRPAALRRARGGILRPAPGPGREQPPSIGGRGRSLLESACNKPAVSRQE